MGPSADTTERMRGVCPATHGPFQGTAKALFLTPFVIAHFVISFFVSFELHSRAKSCPVSSVEFGNEFDS